MGDRTKVWVHVGMPKCGSTSVQRYFSQNHPFFLAQGLCYPAAGRSLGGYRSHEPIFRAKPAEIPDIVEAIRSEARHSSTILISSEAFTSGLPKGNARLLIDELNRVFGAEHVGLLAYFRNVYQFVESSYAQFIIGGLFWIRKDTFFHGASPDMEGFVAAFEAQKGFPIYSLAGYPGLIRNLFPDNKVIVKSIERQDLDGNGLIEDLCATLGVRPAAEAKVHNMRASNMMIALAHYAQCVGSQKEYDLIKTDLRRLANSGRDGASRPFRSSSFSIGPNLYSRIRERIDVERNAVLQLFASGVAGLCDDRWCPPSGRDELTSEEKGRIRDLLSRAGAR